MNVKSVQCCQCGSPLRLTEAPNGATLVVCTHCSALLEVGLSDGHLITRIKEELQVVQEQIEEQQRAELARSLHEQISKLDRRWNLKWLSGFLSAKQARTARKMIGTCTVMAVFVSAACNTARVGGILSEHGHSIAMILGGIGFAVFSILSFYIADRVAYEDYRRRLWIDLRELYRTESSVE